MISLPVLIRFALSSSVLGASDEFEATASSSPPPPKPTREKSKLHDFYG